MKEEQGEVGPRCHLRMARVTGSSHPCGAGQCREPTLPGEWRLTPRVRVDHRSVLCVIQDEHGFHVAELQAVPVFYCIMASSDSELDFLRNTSQKAI